MVLFLVWSIIQCEAMFKNGSEQNQSKLSEWKEITAGKWKVMTSFIQRWRDILLQRDLKLESNRGLSRCVCRVLNPQLGAICHHAGRETAKIKDWNTNVCSKIHYCCQKKKKKQDWGLLFFKHLTKFLTQWILHDLCSNSDYFPCVQPFT